LTVKLTTTPEPEVVFPIPAAFSIVEDPTNPPYLAANPAALAAF